MVERKGLSFPILAGLCGLLLLAQSKPTALRTSEEILRSFVEDFRSVPAASEPMAFGIKVSGEGGGDWHILVAGKKGADGSFQVDLGRGIPPSPAAFYTLDLDTLRKIDGDEINAIDLPQCVEVERIESGRSMAMKSTRLRPWAGPAPATRRPWILG